MICKLRALSLVFCGVVGIVSAKNVKKQKPSQPNKLLSGASSVTGANTCYTTCNNACAVNGCEVLVQSDVQSDASPSLGMFSCECTPCPDGEVGQGAYRCDVGGISDPKTEGSLATSCGGGAFDLGLILGRDDCYTAEGEVHCPSTCVCNSCECDPCASDETCVDRNVNAGGYQCK